MACIESQHCNSATPTTTRPPVHLLSHAAINNNSLHKLNAMASRTVRPLFAAATKITVQWKKGTVLDVQLATGMCASTDVSSTFQTQQQEEPLCGECDEQ
jgi:hypothetical protein